MVPGEIGHSKDRRNKEAQIRFRARTWLSGKIASGIAVQAIVVDGLGRDRRPPVCVTIDGHKYCSTVAPVGRGAQGRDQQAARGPLGAMGQR
jgi:hypothetical protein